MSKIQNLLAAGGARVHSFRQGAAAHHNVQACCIATGIQECMPVTEGDFYFDVIRQHKDLGSVRVSDPSEQ